MLHSDITSNKNNSSNSNSNNEEEEMKKKKNHWYLFNMSTKWCIMRCSGLCSLAYLFNKNLRLIHDSDMLNYWHYDVFHSFVIAQQYTFHSSVTFPFFNKMTFSFLGLMVVFYIANTTAVWLARQCHTLWRCSAATLRTIPAGAEEPDVGRKHENDNTAD